MKKPKHKRRPKPHKFGKLRIPKRARVVDFRVNPDVEKFDPWAQNEDRRKEQ